MKTLQQLKEGSIKRYIKAAFVAAPGEGKTYASATFPKCCFAITAPDEEETWLNVPELRKNIVGWEHFIPSPSETAGAVITRLKRFLREEVRPMVERGDIETLVIDNVTFLAEFFWMKLCNDDKKLYTTKQGVFDSRGAYGGLKDELRDFFLMDVINMPCNVILNIHIMMEDSEALEKKPDKSVPFNMSIPGSFRDKLQGFVSYVFYLEKRATIKDGKQVMQYLARTDKSNGKPAKSRLQLPTVIADVSYETILREITKASKGEQK